MSGGQGTRLGFNGPKGMYDIGLISKKSIFQIHIERIKKISELSWEGQNNNDQDKTCSKGPSVPIYIMTSDLNHDIIVDYFEKNDFFGYPKEDIIFFEQGLEPCFTFDGKVIIENPETLSLAPDGNGGIYKALRHSGSIQDMQRRGVEHLHIYGIDNVLTKSIDPIFMGICIDRHIECGNKVVWRAGKNEKVGVTAEFDRRMHILEYSELPQEFADAIHPESNKLLFGAANICNHYLSLQFLIETVLPNLSGVYHIAKKKIPYWDIQTKQTIQPNEPNGVKLEMFIFDVFPLATKWLVVEVKREDEFAPVKNEPNKGLVDSPDTARAMMTAQAIRWIHQAQGQINTEVTQENGTSSYGLQQCEISPLVSYAGEGLEDRIRGKIITLPTYIH